MEIRVIGGGLAGSEVALSLSEMGIKCSLFEMRPHVQTGVHTSDRFAELVCSNSLKSRSIENASGLLKEEATILGSRLLRIAEECKVPAGKALAVDRERFADSVTEQISCSPFVSVISKEVEELEYSSQIINIVATGPLTSSRLFNHLSEHLGEALYFFDAVSPMVTTESIDMSDAFTADRYGTGEGDYINCPLNEKEYEAFVDALMEAETLPLEGFDSRLLFERCQPVEEIARQGRDALRFGPMKPVGLVDPKTGKQPFAVVQLRKENLQETLMSPVGFQTRLRWKDQKRVFSKIPALKNAEFVRYGVMHRNTYIDSPKTLDPTLKSRSLQNTFFCGQITGLEGYPEAISSGRFVAMNVASLKLVSTRRELPRETMLGSLIDHITRSARSPLKPVYANFGLLPREGLPRQGKKLTRLLQTERALEQTRRFVVEWRNATDGVYC
ncbi:MAG: Methylenetetrahydrofolate--tRNA-(uracil-5-)-methyltransferase TrmFO [Thermotogales bacterium 46_20]|nr:MAG: Methylenetetrahydrofolate--tRNA-(uracil-5-)-methyltransferase TrmFO [Thermotogales bacterium 46_20]